MGVDAVGEATPGSPGSDGASPYLSRGSHRCPALPHHPQELDEADRLPRITHERLAGHSGIYPSDNCRTLRPAGRLIHGG
jgi:hypothetical protein